MGNAPVLTSLFGSTAQAGTAAAAGEIEKDYHHQYSLESSCCLFDLSTCGRDFGFLVTMQPSSHQRNCKENYPYEWF